MAQPHVILFEHPRFRGAHKHVFSEEPNLNDSLDDFFNDKTSSIVILEGDWEFFIDPHYQNKLGEGTLGPGLYPNVDVLGPRGNDSITSLRPVDSGGSSSLLLNILSNIKSEIIKIEEIIERPKHGR